MEAAQDDVEFFYFELGMQPWLIVIISLFFSCTWPPPWMIKNF